MYSVDEAESFGFSHGGTDDRTVPPAGRSADAAGGSHGKKKCGAASGGRHHGTGTKCFECLYRTNG